MISLLIADDHPVVRNGLRGIFAGDPDFEVLGEAASGVEAVALAIARRPQVVLMDLRMPGGDGVSAIRELAERLPSTRVLVLTTYGDDGDVLAAMHVYAKLGVNDRASAVAAGYERGLLSASASGTSTSSPSRSRPRR